MFLQLRFSRDGARFRGALGQATTEAGVPTGADGPLGPHRGCAGRRGGVPTVLTSSQAPGFLTLSPYMVTGASPHERAHANAQGDGNGER